jgi:large subunit ribosomal protein L17
MRHLREGRKLKRTSSHRKALLRNMATSLFEHKKITTTLAKAKELRPYAESLITKAKHALIREKQGLLTGGQTIDIHNRRVVGRVITNKAVLQELFDTIAPKVEERPGGYTRIIKAGFRFGDGGDKAIIELVDFAAPQDGTVSLKAKRKKAKGIKPIVKKEIKHAEVIEEDTEVIADETKPETEVIEEDVTIAQDDLIQEVETQQPEPQQSEIHQVAVTEEVVEKVETLPETQPEVIPVVEQITEVSSVEVETLPETQPEVIPVVEQITEAPIVEIENTVVMESNVKDEQITSVSQESEEKQVNPDSEETKV